ncbi:MAG: ATP-binding cassette domain-containing protein [Actinomycetia bacterium]|nr:ATP-binding cassette domain-containing protein [Actinomycetes bacterium]
MTDRPAIQVERVSKSFGSVKALDHVDLQVEAGTILALLGPNGAGKTTLIRVLTTLLRPDTGNARVGSFDVLRQPQQVRLIMGLAGQSAAIDENLTGKENIEMVGKLYHLDSASIEKQATKLLNSFGLDDAANRIAKTYSGGMRRRLDLAASLVGRPKILFLDEPTTGLDPQSRLELWGMIEDLVSEGVTVLLTTQYLEEADYLADKIAVIDHGQIIALGSPEELKSKVGSDVVEMRLSDRSRVQKAAEILSKYGSGKPTVEDESGTIILPVDQGPSVLADVVRELDASQFAIADLNFRRPSLDEAFLALTGRPTTVVEEGAEKTGKTRRRKTRGKKL